MKEKRILYSFVDNRRITQIEYTFIISRKRGVTKTFINDLAFYAKMIAEYTKKEPA